MILRHYPKCGEPGTLRIRRELTALLRARTAALGIAAEELLFANQVGQPVSWSTFRGEV